jgi:hypothetical protein
MSFQIEITKQTPRSRIAALARNLELFLSIELAPDFHRRRECKPVAAKSGESAKSSHKLFSQEVR